MPHFERSIFRWNWANYPADRKGVDISPWIQVFVNAREWLERDLMPLRHRVDEFWGL